MVCLKMFNDTNDVIWPLNSDKVLESDVGVGHFNSDKRPSDNGHSDKRQSDKEFGRCKSSMLRYKTHLFHFAETVSRLPRFVRPDPMNMTRSYLYSGDLNGEELNCGNICETDFYLSVIQMLNNFPVFKWNLNSGKNVP